jgi:antitoxin component YwqK of YwqJK toxin-antitoxin module/Flp pilus assembly protein TadD
MKKVLFLLLLVSNHFFAQKDYSLTYNSQEIIQNGVKLHEEEKYLEAIKQYDRIVTIDPSYVTAQYEKAMSLIALKKNDEARKLFETLFDNNQMKEEPNLFTLYASFLSDNKEYDKSETIFKAGEKYMSNSTNFLYNHAILKVRKEERQATVDLLKKILTINPNSASAHYLMGLICLEDGKIVEGTMALMSYLVIAPTGSKANDVILKLNKKYGENFLEKSKLTYTKSGDNFEEIETILRNQLPLRKAYKINSEIDDIIIRQIQAISEYSVEHKMGDGFFENIYIPWIKDMYQKGKFEGFTYYMLLSMENDLGKKLTSQKKTITDFYQNYIEKDFWSVFAKRKLEHFGKVEEVVISISDSRPFLIGKIVNGKKEGKYKVLDEYGNMYGELNTENDELEGLQKYFNDEGKLINEKSFSKSNLNGKRTGYNDLGQITIVENYKEDKLEGETYSNHTKGGKQCEGVFVNGEREGKFTCYYPNGTVRNEMYYKAGKLNGTYKMFAENGDLTIDANYTDDELDGNYVKYFVGKIKNIEAKYAKGKVLGSYKNYFINGTLENEYFYENGKIKRSIENYATGVKSMETIYDENEKVQTYIYYNSKGEIYYQENFKGGDLKTVVQYSKNNPKPTEANVTKKAFDIKNIDGGVILSGEYDKGIRTGEWKYYYSNGTLRQKKNFVKGDVVGTTYSYDKDGELDVISHYKNDSLSGLYEQYYYGKLTRESYYSSNEKNGPEKVFYKDGSLKSESYFVAGELAFTKNTYWQNGKIMKKEKYEEDELLSVEYFNNKGEKETEFDYRGKTGNFTIKLNGGMVIHNFELKNGTYNGKYTVKDKFNNPMIEVEFVNGNRTGVYKSYSPSGAVDYENNYYSGYANGIEKTFDLTGILKLTEENIYGTEFGTTTRYFANKSKHFDYTQFNGVREGEYKFYNQKGEAIVALGYLNNALIYYKKLDKTGALTEKVDVANETVTIESKYANGKTAMIVSYLKGNKNGKYAIYNQEGKTEIEANYKNDVVNGERSEYYPNGKLYKIERMVMNNYEGFQEFYKEDGKLWLKAEYKNDELHGTTQVYVNGVLTVTKKYDSDELLEIIK